MPIDASKVQWDSIDPAQVQWDETKKQTPTLMQGMFGKSSMKDYLLGRAEDAGKLFNPDTWKGLASDLTKPLPPFPRKPDGSPDMSFSPDQIRAGGEMAMAMMPVTQFGKASRAAFQEASGIKPVDAARSAIEKSLADAGKAGYTVPRSYISNNPLVNIGERLGTKTGVEWTARAKSQANTDKLIAKSLGLSDDAIITPEVLSQIRDQAGKAYNDIANVGTLTADKAYKSGLSTIAKELSGASRDFPELASKQVAELTSALNKKTISSEGAVEMIKSLRGAAKSNLQYTANAEQKLLGRAQTRAATLLEDLIERNIEPRVGKDMLDSFRAARKLIAKTYSVEKALSGNNVSAAALGKQLSKGVPLEGGMLEAAKFGQAFPRLGRVEMSAPVPGGAMDPVILAALAKAAGGGNPAAAFSGALPIVGRPIARHLMTTVPKPENMSPFIENMLLQRSALWGSGGLLGE